MSDRVRAAGLSVLVVLSCALAAGGASAYEMSMSPAGSFTTTSSGAVTFSAGGIEISCNMTLAGTLASSASRMEVAGTTIGSVTEAAFSGCRGAEEPPEPLLLPWVLQAQIVLGNPPREITGILYSHSIVIEIRAFGLECLYSANMRYLWTYVNNQSTQLRLLRLELVFNRGSFLCPSGGTLLGSFSTSPTQTATFI